MLDPSTLLLFVAAGLILNLTPGPDVLYIVARSVGQGRGAGLLSALGISAGCVVHMLAAALGVSALLQLWPLAFDVLRWLGAAYLVFLGIAALHTRGATAATPPPEPPARLFWQGFATNVLNPKVGLFFLAFLPQFTDAGRGPVATQILMLGAIFIFNGFWVCAAYACAAAKLRGWLARTPTAASMAQRGSGLVMLGLGLHLALSRVR